MTAATFGPAWPEDRVVFDDLEIGEIAVELDDQEPQDVLEWAFGALGDRLAIVTALQVDGVVVLDMATRIRPDVRVLTVDTGRLPPETHAFLDQVRARYPETRWQVLRPDPAAVQQMVDRHGTESFRHSVQRRLACCRTRKVTPLVGALREVDGWCTGLRRDQWASRAAIRKVELDHDHEGIVKINALADWTSEEVWHYVTTHDVPTHPLYAHGYTSIGCGPCTRPVQAGEDDRAGRWWWETGAPKECGIHCPIETGNFEHDADALLTPPEHDT